MKLQEELVLPQPIAQLPHEALMNIYYTASRAKKKADEFFRTRGLTDVQFNVMMLLVTQSGDDGGLAQVDLSRMMLVNRANITSLIDRMEKANLVKRVAAPDDRRYNIVKLTTLGRKLYDGVVQEYAENTRIIMRGLNQKDTRLLIGYLERIRESLDAVSTGTP